MSEHEFYEWQTVDRPLTGGGRREPVVTLQPGLPPRSWGRGGLPLRGRKAFTRCAAILRNLFKCHL